MQLVVFFVYCTIEIRFIDINFNLGGYSMDSTKRFTERVDNYVKYRPSYPQALIDFLFTELGFTEQSVIADVGSGTGIFTKLLLEQGSHVIAIEPNSGMRTAAEEQLQAFEGFVSVEGTAEDTRLEAASVDYLVSAQAFHWFNRAEAKQEFSRILKPDGKVVLIWNNRVTDKTPFDRAYEEVLLAFGKDYTAVRHTNIQEKDLRTFFKEGQYVKQSFLNGQVCDFDGMKGRVLSSSYMPLPHEATYPALLERLKSVFDTYNENGYITITYNAEIYYGEA
ncbi:hypothetical protein D3C73_483990 [compost metagenome]